MIVPLIIATVVKYTIHSLQKHIVHAAVAELYSRNLYRFIFFQQ